MEQELVWDSEILRSSMIFAMHVFLFVAKNWRQQKYRNFAPWTGER